MTRVLSQHGNVIAADFRPRARLDASILIETEILYQDDRIVLSRTTATLGGRPFMVTHFMGDMVTGEIVNL